MTVGYPIKGRCGKTSLEMVSAIRAEQMRAYHEVVNGTVTHTCRKAEGHGGARGRNSWHGCECGRNWKG